RRPRDADADDEPAEPLAALSERDVVGVARDDDDVGDVVEPEEVLDDIHGEADVGAVLGGGGREQLGQVDGAVDGLALVARIHGNRPVGVGPTHHDRSEGGRVVEDRADVDAGVGDPLLRAVGGVARVVALERAPAEQLVVARDDDVVEVDVDGDSRRLGRLLRHGASLLRGYSSRWRRSSATTAMSANTTIVTPLSTHAVSAMACGMNDTNAPAAAGSSPRAAIRTVHGSHVVATSTTVANRNTAT